MHVWNKVTWVSVHVSLDELEKKILETRLISSVTGNEFNLLGFQTCIAPIDIEEKRTVL